ncbi:MAG: hypothetical protein KDF64_21965 [Geminicoccaceae bacterium]|nr:hypothetical protein [Geminicoccaceae bacterium]
MMLMRKAEQAAELLVRTRGEDRTLDDLPAGLAPATLAEAYAVQDAVLRLIGPPGGWKVAGKLGGEPRCSILPAADFHASGTLFDIPSQGFDVEVEIAFVFAHTVPDRLGLANEDDILAAIGSAHLALELCASRFADRRSLPDLTPVADLQGNAAVVLGAAVEGWRALVFENLPLQLKFADKVLDLSPRNTGLPELLKTLCWLANHARERGVPLRAEDTIITGARLGPVNLGSATEIAASCSGLPEVRAFFRHNPPTGE